MDNKPTRQEPADRGEGKIAPRTPGKAEGERRDSGSGDDDTLEDDISNAADEAGSAFLPRDKVLTDPKKP